MPEPQKPLPTPKFTDWEKPYWWSTGCGVRRTYLSGFNIHRTEGVLEITYQTFESEESYHYTRSTAAESDLFEEPEEAWSDFVNAKRQEFEMLLPIQIIEPEA